MEEAMGTDLLQETDRSPLHYIGLDVKKNVEIKILKCLKLLLNT